MTGMRAILLMVTLLLGPTTASAETIKIGQTTRHYTAQFPELKLAPLVIVLHGNTQTGADMITRTAWPRVAKRENFAVVFPDGLNHSWADLRPNDLRAGRAAPHGTDDVAVVT